jgi:hypothetical protein
MLGLYIFIFISARREGFDHVDNIVLRVSVIIIIVIVWRGLQLFRGTNHVG